MRFKNRPEWLGDDKMSVNIEIECEEGYDAKRFERGDTLRYYFKGIKRCFKSQRRDWNV